MPVNMEDWKHKDLWSRRSDYFCVEVSRHTSHSDFIERGENRWCVYAYIYPTHPHFKNFSGSDMWQEASTVLPLHGGPSMLRWHKDVAGHVTSIQVGADYDHDGDEWFADCATADDASTVFWDADELFKWLENYGKRTDAASTTSEETK